MKKLILIVISLTIIFSCAKEKKKITTDELMMERESTMKLFNQRSDGSILVRDMYTEGESTIVIEYNVDSNFPPLEFSIEKSKQTIKDGTPIKDILMMKESSLNAKYRYYIDNKLIKEVVISKDEW